MRRYFKIGREISWVEHGVRQFLPAIELETLENIEGAIQNIQSGNIGYKRRRQTKYNTICEGHHYAQTITNSANKTWALLQTAESEIYYYFIFVSVQ